MPNDSPTAEPTVQPTSPPAVQPVVTAAVPPVGGPTVAGDMITVPRDEVYAPDGNTWRRKHFGSEGARKQHEARWLEEKGSLEAQIQQLNQELAQATAKSTSLEAEMAKLERIPELEGQISELKPLADKAEKYRAALQFPRLLTLQTEKEITPEDGGEPVTITVNPVLELIEHSTMNKAALVETLRLMVNALPDAGKLPTVDVMGPATPAPTTEPTDEKASLIQQAREAKEKYLETFDEQYKTQMAELSHRIRELEIEGAGV